MADYKDLIEALQGMDRSFGREDLSGTWETLLAKMDKNLNAEKEFLDQKQKALETQKNDAKSGDVIKAIDEELKKVAEALQKNADNKMDLHKGSAVSYGRSKAIEKLSGQQGYNVFNKGKSLKQTGDAISKLGKGFGGLGKAVSMTGGLMTKLAGPIGLVIQGLQMAFDWYKKSTEAEIKRQQFNAKDVVAQHRIKQREIQTASQILSNNASAASSIQGAMASAASAAQSAAGAFAQEAVGIHSELAVAGKKIEYEAYANAHEIVSSMPFDIKAGMYKSAESAISFASQARGYQINDKYGDQAIGIAAAKMSNTISGAMGQASAQIRGASAQAGIQNAAASTIGARDAALLREQRAISKADMSRDYKWSVRAANDPTNVIVGLAKTVADVGWKAKTSPRRTQFEMNQARVATQNAKTTVKAQAASTNAGLAAQRDATNIQLATQSRDANLSIKKQQIDMKKNIEQAAKDAAEKIAQAWLKMTEKLNDTFLKHQQASTIMGREMGMTGHKLENYSEKMGQYQVEVSKWGKDLEWMQKLQGGYQETSGRNIELSQADFETSGGLGLVVGDDTIAKYVGGMEIFNHSVEDSNEKLYTMFKDVSKIGLNGKKYAKDLAQNLKLAEKYNFKGGVDGLMRMSKWAQNMRFNVDSLDGMLDKVQTGGLEGVVKQSAELQVLGGNFAMGSDPLAMAYESYMDPEGYAKRMNKMIAGQGFFDSKSGEASFGIASQQIMRQFAESTGQDYKDVLNQARAQVKLGQIGQTLSSKGFNEKQQSLIANKAQYDTKDGKWKVQIGKEEKDIDNLDAKDIEALTPADPTEIQQNMLLELQSLRSVQEQMQGQEKRNMARLESSVWKPLKETNERIIASIGEDFNKNFETYKTEALQNLKLMEETQKSWFQMFEAGNEEVDTEVQAIDRAAMDICNTINQVKESVEEHIGAAMGEGVGTYGIGGTGVGVPKLPDDEEEIIIPEETKTFNWERVGNWFSSGWEATKEWGKDAAKFAGGVATGAAAGFEMGGMNGALIGALAGGGMQMFGPELEEFGKWWDNTITKNVDEFGEGCSDWCGTAAKDVGDLFSGVAGDAGKFWDKNVSKRLDKFSKKTSKWWDSWTVEGVLTDIGTTATDKFTDIKRTVGDVVTDIGTTATDKFTDIKRTVGDVVSDIGKTATDKFTGIKKQWDNWSISDYVNQATTTVSNAFTKLSNFWDNWSISDILTKFRNKISNAFSGIADSVKKKMDEWGVTDFIQKIWSPIKTGFESIKKGIGKLGSFFGGISKIWSGSGSVTDALRNVFNYMTGRMTSSDQIRFGVDDGIVYQNGRITRIDDNDQVLAAKNGGPIDKMLNIISKSNNTPLPKHYDSFVRNSLYANNSDGKIEIKPIQININGVIQLNGNNGSVDLTQQISQDPNFIRALSQMITAEVQKSVNGGRASDIFNRLG